MIEKILFFQSLFHKVAWTVSETGAPPQHLPAAARRIPSVCDELCPDDYFNHLLQQRRDREAQLQRLDLEDKFSFGFKPTNVKKPF